MIHVAEVSSFEKMLFATIIPLKKCSFLAFLRMEKCKFTPIEIPGIIV
jgi:hypothetical protein